MFEVHNPEKDWSQQVEHMQVQNGTGPGVWRSKRPPVGMSHPSGGGSRILVNGGGGGSLPKFWTKYQLLYLKSDERRKIEIVEDTSAMINRFLWEKW